MKLHEEHETRKEEAQGKDDPEKKKEAYAPAAMTPRTQALESEGKPIPPIPFLQDQRNDDPAETTAQSSSGNCSTPLCKASRRASWTSGG